MIIGIDVSKDKLAVHVLPSGQSYTIKNSRASILGFLKKQVDLTSLEQVVFEPTGGYEKLLQSCLLHQGIDHHLVHPTRVYHFAKGKGYFAKTDRIDAKILAHYGEQLTAKAHHVVSESELILKEYASRRQQIKAMINQERQRLHAIYLSSDMQRSIKRLLRHLEQELKRLTEKMVELVRNHAVLSERQALLQTVKGVGPEVALTLITQLPELGEVSREEIAGLVGVAPQTRESGQTRRYRPISQGRFYVRRALYMAALVAVRYNPRMKKIYEGLLARGKLKKVALVAVMRKMIIMLNAMVKNQTPWESQRI